MLDATQTTDFDAFESANNPQVQTYDLFGRVEINAWAGALVKGQGRIPFDPSNPDHKRLTMIDVFIQPLPEIDVKYPKTLECHWIAEFPEWAKITLPSIKALGVDNVREINGKYARVARVPSGKKYPAKDAQGNLTGEMKDETTFKFVAFFADEDSCRAAYVAAGGQASSNGNGHNTSEPVNADDAEKQTALAFLKVVVQNAARGKKPDEATEAVRAALASTNYPVVSKHFTVDSPETKNFISEFCDFPF